MTPDIPSLSQHLLTRSDLADLAVPAGDVVRWLSSGTLQQIGTLSRDGADGEPVFAVTDRAVREDLAGRLTALGKDEVVFSPLRVRSVLMRALLALHGTVNIEVIGETPAAATAETEFGAAEAIGDALAEAATDLEREVTQFLEMARDEARLEALERAAEFAAQEAMETPIEPEYEQLPPDVEFDFGGEPAPEAEPSEDGEFFDVDDLTDELDSWGPQPAHDPAPAADPTPDDTQPEPAADAALTTTMTEAEPEVASPQNAIEADVFAAFDAFEKPAPATTAAAVPEPGTSIQEDVFAAFDAFEAPAGEPSLEELVEPEAAAALADDAPVPVEDEVAAETTDEVTAVTETVEEPAVEAAEIEREPEAQAEAAAAAAAAQVAVALETHEPVVASRSEPAGTAVAPSMTSQGFERIESYLADLKAALLEIAQRPQPASPPAPHVQVEAVDMQPLVAAVGEFGARVEHGVAIAVHAALSSHTQKPASTPVAVPFVHAPANRSHFVLLTVTVLLTCWAAIFWLKTGSANLALGTFLGANAIACCMLVGQRR